MKNRKKIEAICSEIQLPEPIIQHIQSFLNGKQAAQTTLLSKLWYTAYSTRPNLDFDERHFQKSADSASDKDSESQVGDEFVNFVMKTMQRYEELNLKIESFKLWIKSTERNLISGADELIVKALKMGANDLNLEFSPPKLSIGRYVLPHEVLESKTLVRLSATWCGINKQVDRKVICPRLKSLSLFRVCIQDDDIVRDIILKCPSIENLVLSDCVRSGDLRLAFRSPSLTKFEKQSFESEFRGLNCLFLERVRLDSSFLDDFSIKFPCLESLTLIYCCDTDYEEIEISSQSLKFISLATWVKKRLRLTFNLPKLRKFTYSGSNLPILSFKPPLSEWESDMSFSLDRSRFSATFFVDLTRFLRKLRSSKISLSLRFGYANNIANVEDAKGCLRKPVVENLMLSIGLRDESLAKQTSVLDGLFWSFHPKLVTLNWIDRNNKWQEEANKVLLKLLCKKLIIQQESQDCCIPNKRMIGQSDLEEVNVEFFEETLSEWRPFLPWKTLLDASRSPEECRLQIRFRLRWGTT